MVALNVAHTRIYTQNSLIVFNRTAPCACRLCSAFPNRDTSRTQSSMRVRRTAAGKVLLFLGLNLLWHHRDHTQQTLVQSLEVLLYFKYQT